MSRSLNNSSLNSSLSTLAPVLLANSIAKFTISLLIFDSLENSSNISLVSIKRFASEVFAIANEDKKKKEEEREKKREDAEIKNEKKKENKNI